MSQNNRLQFSVEESICFQKGQEVLELLSISLDPDISVQEVNDYVSIRGSLELTGEYNIDQTREYAELPATSRVVEEVRLKEEGIAELTHCFPVDITIPKNKVNHLNDVFVFIDAFDYQLTDPRMLTIQADLAIEGLLNMNGETEEAQHPQTSAVVEEELEPIDRSGSNAEEKSEESIDFANLHDEITDEEVNKETVPIYQAFTGEKPFVTPSLSAQERLKKEELKADESEESASFSGEKPYVAPSQSAQERLKKEELKADESEGSASYSGEKPYVAPLQSAQERLKNEELKADESEQLEPVYRSYSEHEETKETEFFDVPRLLKDEENKSDEESFDIEVKQEMSEEEREAEETEMAIEIPEYSFYKQEKTEEPRDEEESDAPAKENDNALYLTKLFTKQGEEEFSRMKMCIVQQNDTIDLLCERYDINVQQLIRLNSLSIDEELEEGQILYIPDYNSSHA
ncbi:LysM peptidoglycan-binding domain-containing protein [Bacillus sp. CLL-7-23]|uniref:LysM peptidoglycan-binding domain-containing protein n=1 Tax=Bacillus changyiensis TaxID=3004103 RepID=A0ABT4X5W4_9BACI|nr:LysM peptidoglycan-binding domain-containing protein [Bacillus changyiensis]MDA7027593.1 LysM peptidoglycan-binding domain-containing protein [Bacillus changyiensis]